MPNPQPKQYPLIVTVEDMATMLADPALASMLTNGSQRFAIPVSEELANTLLTKSLPESVVRGLRGVTVGGELVKSVDVPKAHRDSTSLPESFEGLQPKEQKHFVHTNAVVSGSSLHYWGSNVDGPKPRNAAGLHDRAVSGAKGIGLNEREHGPLMQHYIKTFKAAYHNEYAARGGRLFG